jgi:excisionase family DNA binding protein
VYYLVLVIWHMATEPTGIRGKTETREVMGVREAAAYLGISRDTLYKYISKNRIPAFRLGNRWKVKKTVLDRWMEAESSERTHGPASEGSREA